MTRPLAPCPRCVAGQECQRAYPGPKGGWWRCRNFSREQSRAHARMLMGQVDAVLVKHKALKERFGNLEVARGD